MAGNDDLDEGQRALSDGESVAVPSRDGSDSDVAPPKLTPALRKLRDTLSPGELTVLNPLAAHDQSSVSSFTPPLQVPSMATPAFHADPPTTTSTTVPSSTV